MTMKILLTAALAGVVLYHLAHARRRRWVSLAAVMGAVCGIFFVWNPEVSNDLAELLGVGRGADMVFYSMIPIGAALFLGIHIRLQTQHEMITELSRSVAIAAARRPTGPDGSA